MTDIDVASEFSDVTTGSVNPLYTCLTCQVAFHTADNQRDHYRNDWHRYNLKRKVAGLTPISEEIFKSRILAKQQQQQQENEKKQNSNYKNCEACKKNFNSENAYKNHIISKKHLENQAKYDAKKQNVNNSETKENENTNNISNTRQKEPKINWKKKLAEANTQEELDKIIDEKISMSIKLEETDCLFCNYHGKDFDDKMEHMTTEHTFFIPDIEYLVDLKGLINYLSEKISIGNTCIYCKHAFHSLEAIQKHMIDKGHCKIRYDEEADVEISDYYDFSSTYEDEGINPDEELDPNYNVLSVTAEGSELILPTGAHIGHRDYRRYYRQNLRYHNEPESIQVSRLEHLTQRYQALGYYNIGSSGQTIEQERLGKMKAARDQFRDYQIRREKLGIKANKLQKYYRAQIM